MVGRGGGGRVQALMDTSRFSDFLVVVVAPLYGRFMERSLSYGSSSLVAQKRGREGKGGGVWSWLSIGGKD